MQFRNTVSLCGATLGLAVAPALASAAPAPVTVRVEGAGKTLLAPTTVQAPASGSINKGGAPNGICPAHSAAGAFNRAVHGRWTATYYPGTQGGLFVTSILAIKPPTRNDYWMLFVDNRVSDVGACLVKPHRGEQILFAIGNGTQFPIVLSAPSQVRVGGTIQVKATYYDARGKRKPLAGVQVRGRGVSVLTNAHGIARVPVTHAGRLTVRGARHGYVRSAPVQVTELP